MESVNNAVILITLLSFFASAIVAIIRINNKFLKLKIDTDANTKAVEIIRKELKDMEQTIIKLSTDFNDKVNTINTNVEKAKAIIETEMKNFKGWLKSQESKIDRIEK